MIPWSRPSIGKEEQEAVNHVVSSGWISQGIEVDAFEQEIAEYLGCEYVVCCSSGTMGLMMAYIFVTEEYFSEKKLPRHTKVFIPSSTFISTATTPILLGFDVEFIDVDQYALMDCDLLSERANQLKRSDKFILALVHLMGNHFRMDEVRTSVVAIEDCCQAFGAKQLNGKMIGSNSEFAVFSFHTGKIITTGEGGCIATNNKDIYEGLKQIRNHGGLRKDYGVQALGSNFRMTDIQAGIGRVQLRKIHRFIDHRKKLVQMYDELLKNINSTCENRIKLKQEKVNLFYQFVTTDPYKVGLHLTDEGVDTRRFFPNIIRNPRFKDHRFTKGDKSMSDMFFSNSLLLPMGNGITEEEVNYVCKKIKEYF